MASNKAIRFGLPRLGDFIEKALSSVGVTEERVSGWLGKPCGCKERRKKLNALSDWVNRKLGMTDEEAAAELEKLTAEDKQTKE
jgi:hypothetical protein